MNFRKVENYIFCQFAFVAFLEEREFFSYFPRCALGLLRPQLLFLEGGSSKVWENDLNATFWVSDGSHSYCLFHQ